MPPSSHSDSRVGVGIHSSPHLRDLPASRGRPPPLNNTPGLLSQPQASARAISPRSQPTNEELPTRPLPGSLERRPSATYGHHRQTSIVRGVTQHSRNPSLSSSSNLSHRSPQPVFNGSAQSSFSSDTPSLAGLSTESPSPYFTTSPATTVNGSAPSYSSSSTRVGEREANEIPDNMLTQKRADRVQNGRTRKDHSRSQSKHQNLPEQIGVGQYALHHLFNSVSQHPCFFRHIMTYLRISLSVKRIPRSTNAYKIL